MLIGGYLSNFLENFNTKLKQKCSHLMIAMILTEILSKKKTNIHLHYPEVAMVSRTLWCRPLPRTPPIPSVRSVLGSLVLTMNLMVDFLPLVIAVHTFANVQPVSRQSVTQHNSFLFSQASPTA